MHGEDDISGTTIVGGLRSKHTARKLAQHLGRKYRFHSAQPMLRRKSQHYGVTEEERMAKNMVEQRRIEEEQRRIEEEQRRIEEEQRRISEYFETSKHAERSPAKFLIMLEELSNEPYVFDDIDIDTEMGGTSDSKDDAGAAAGPGWYGGGSTYMKQNGGTKANAHINRLINLEMEDSYHDFSKFMSWDDLKKCYIGYRGPGEITETPKREAKMLKEIILDQNIGALERMKIYHIGLSTEAMLNEEKIRELLGKDKKTTVAHYIESYPNDTKPMFEANQKLFSPENYKQLHEHIIHTENHINIVVRDAGIDLVKDPRRILQNCPRKEEGLGANQDKLYEYALLSSLWDPQTKSVDSYTNTMRTCMMEDGDKKVIKDFLHHREIPVTTDQVIGEYWSMVRIAVEGNTFTYGRMGGPLLIIPESSSNPSGFSIKELSKLIKQIKLNRTLPAAKDEAIKEAEKEARQVIMEAALRRRTSREKAESDARTAAEAAKHRQDAIYQILNDFITYCSTRTPPVVPNEWKLIKFLMFLKRSGDWTQAIQTINTGHIMESLRSNLRFGFSTGDRLAAAYSIVYQHEQSTHLSLPFIPAAGVPDPATAPTMYTIFENLGVLFVVPNKSSNGDMEKKIQQAFPGLVGYTDATISAYHKFAVVKDLLDDFEVELRPDKVLSPELSQFTVTHYDPKARRSKQYKSSTFRMVKEPSLNDWTMFFEPETANVMMKLWSKINALIGIGTILERLPEDVSFRYGRDVNKATMIAHFNSIVDSVKRTVQNSYLNGFCVRLLDIVENTENIRRTYSNEINDKLDAMEAAIRHITTPL